MSAILRALRTLPIYVVTGRTKYNAFDVDACVPCLDVGTRDGSTNAGSALDVTVLANVDGLVAWKDYVPVQEEAGRTVPYSYDSNGYFPIRAPSNASIFAANARYWRLYVTANNGSAGYVAIDDIKFFNGASEHDRTGKTKTGSHAGAFGNTYSADKAFDGFGDPYAAIAVGNLPVWWKIDFATAVTVTKIQLGRGTTMSANEAPKDFLLQYSGDDSTWTTWKTVSGQTTWDANTLYDFTI